MTKSPAGLREQIEEQLKRGSNYYVIARRFGTTITVVNNVAGSLGLSPSEVDLSKVVDLRALVPKRLEKFILQIKPICGTWNFSSHPLMQARHAYDAGRVELVTGRISDGRQDYLVLYQIPRKIVDKKRRPYFSVTYEG